MMSKVLDYYKEGMGGNCLQILRNGMSFLHTLSQRDDHYMERHTVVEHQYVCLVRELTKLFESFEENIEESKYQQVNIKYTFKRVSNRDQQY